MRHFTTVLIVGVLAALAQARDLGNVAPLKPATSIIPINVPAASRQGGDTIASATVIPDLPFQDAGNTAGYNDDYDEICPFTQSTSPDVVYRFTPDQDLWVFVDLCGSTYDTKVYVYDGSLNVVACNDDFYNDDVCGIYTSRIDNVSLAEGETYSIVVDGYGGDCGAYVLEVSAFGLFCPLWCPEEGFDEGEPPLVTNYVDNYNGGCNTPGNPFQSLTGDASGALYLCGVAGWYDYYESDYRDTDWYLLTMGPAGVITVTLAAEWDTYFFEIAPQDCNNCAVAQLATVQSCEEVVMTITGYEPGATVWFWAGSTVFTSPGGGMDSYSYHCAFTGLDPGIRAEATTWSTLKALYE